MLVATELYSDLKRRTGSRNLAANTCMSFESGRSWISTIYRWHLAAFFTYAKTLGPCSVIHSQKLSLSHDIPLEKCQMTLSHSEYQCSFNYHFLRLARWLITPPIIFSASFWRSNFLFPLHSHSSRTFHTPTRFFKQGLSFISCFLFRIRLPVTSILYF